MATREHWEAVSNDAEMWNKVIGKPKEDPAESMAQVERIFRGVPIGSTCLEIGAGVGRLMLAAERLHRAYSLYGVDSSSALYKRGLEYLIENKSKHTFLTFGNGTELPFGKCVFDFVYSFTCFQHMPTLDIVRANIAEAHRVLNYGGVCRIQTVKGTPDPGRYDGVVFPATFEFWMLFEEVGFTRVDIDVDGEHIWVTAKKSEPDGRTEA